MMTLTVPSDFLAAWVTAAATGSAEGWVYSMVFPILFTALGVRLLCFLMRRSTD